MLAYVRDKWKPAALRAFLHNPAAHYTWIRMPDFRFTDQEIQTISAFILNEPIAEDGKGEPVAPLKGTPDVAHGKELVETLGCLNCHNAGPSVTNKAKGAAFKEISGAKWAQGCLGEKDEVIGKAPNFHLNAEQRGALLSFVATDRASLTQEAMPEFAERQIASMRCTVCHNRDGNHALWEPGTKDENELEAEQDKYKEPENTVAPDGDNKEGDTKEGGGNKVKQHIPSITWIGEKLKPEWAAQFIDGKMDYKPRIWLKARMPGFHSRASLIAKGLAIEHGYPTVNPPEIKPDPEQAEIGARLVVEKRAAWTARQAATKSAAKTRARKKAFEWPSINFKFIRSALRWNRSITSGCTNLFAHGTGHGHDHLLPKARDQPEDRILRWRWAQAVRGHVALFASRARKSSRPIPTTKTEFLANTQKTLWGFGLIRRQTLAAERYNRGNGGKSAAAPCF